MTTWLLALPPATIGIQALSLLHMTGSGNQVYPRGITSSRCGLRCRTGASPSGSMTDPNLGHPPANQRPQIVIVPDGEPAIPSSMIPRPTWDDRYAQPNSRLVYAGGATPAFDWRGWLSHQPERRGGDNMVRHSDEIHIPGIGLVARIQMTFMQHTRLDFGPYGEHDRYLHLSAIVVSIIFEPRFRQSRYLLSESGRRIGRINIAASLINAPLENGVREDAEYRPIRASRISTRDGRGLGPANEMTALESSVNLLSGMVQQQSAEYQNIDALEPPAVHQRGVLRRRILFDWSAEWEELGPAGTRRVGPDPCCSRDWPRFVED